MGHQGRKGRGDADQGLASHSSISPFWCSWRQWPMTKREPAMMALSFVCHSIKVLFFCGEPDFLPKNSQLQRSALPSPGCHLTTNSSPLPGSALQSLHSSAQLPPALAASHLTLAHPGPIPEEALTVAMLRTAEPAGTWREEWDL